MEPLTPADYNSLASKRLSLPPSDFEVLATKYLPFDSSRFISFAEFRVLRLSVKLRTSGEVEQLSFIVKSPPVLEACADFVANIRAFYKESEIYDGVLNDFRESLTAKISPEIFLANSNKFIVLENVFDVGFRKNDFKREFNLHDCELVLNALARLHACSLVFEEKKSVKIPDVYPNILFETVYSDETNHPGFDFMCTGINVLETLVTTHFTHFPKSVIKDTMSMVRNLPFKLKPSENYRNVLNHGAVWAENALFFGGPDGHSTDVNFIDFSNARYAPPACDVLIFLHLSTSRAFRELHQGALMTHYYSRLAKEVQTKGFDLGELLPWIEFEASCQHYLGAAIVAALMYIHVTLLPESALSSVAKDPNTMTAFMFEDRSEIVLSAYTYDATYRRRLSQALIQALEYTQFRGRRRSSVYISA